MVILKVGMQKLIVVHGFKAWLGGLLYFQLCKIAVKLKRGKGLEHVLQLPAALIIL